MIPYGTTYGVKLQGAFDALPIETRRQYTWKISELNYTGNAENVWGTAEPLIHTWTDDDAFASIRGSQMKVSFISQTLRLADLSRTEDNAYRLDVYYNVTPDSRFGTKRTLFSGFMVPNDCKEMITDLTHEIELTFTDGLGLLKDISFADANAQASGDVDVVEGRTVTTIEVVTVGLFVQISGAQLADVGDTLYLPHTNNPDADGAYRVTKVVASGPGFLYYTSESIGGVLASQITRVIAIHPIDLNDVNSLANYVLVCLHNTGILADTYFYSRLFYLASGGEGWLLQDVHVKGIAFAELTAYDVLEAICKTYGLTIFQAEGVWRMVRWHDNRYNVPAATEFDGRRYDENFGVVGTAANMDTLMYTYQQMEQGIEMTMQRPISKALRTFDYKFPENVIYNSDLQILGDFVSEEVVGDVAYKKYRAIGFENYEGTFIDRYIVVAYNSEGIEQDRYIQIEEVSDNKLAIRCEPFEVNEGGRITINFEYAPLDEVDSSADYLNAAFKLNSDANYYYLNDDATWQTGGSSDFHISRTPGVTAARDWQTFSITAKEFPVDGLMYVYLGSFYSGIGAGSATLIRNLKVSYDLNGDDVNYQSHTHTFKSGTLIKDIQEADIIIDDSPANCINGSTFTANILNLIHERTGTEWYQWPGRPTSYLSGEIITYDNAYYKRKLRREIECNLLNVWNENPLEEWDIMHAGRLIVLSSLTPVAWIMFICGKLEINYRANQCSCTLIELWEAGTDEDYVIPHNNYKLVKTAR